MSPTEAPTTTRSVLQNASARGDRVGKLPTLDDRPLSWAELDEQVAEYWRTHERDGSEKELLRLLGSHCLDRAHGRCRGRRFVAGRPAGPCECACHGGSGHVPPVACIMPVDTR